MIRTILSLALLLSVGLLLPSCRHNLVDEPNTFLVASLAEELKPTHTIAQLKALYQGGATPVTDEVVIDAIVISDDTEGNLYRTAYISDSTGGLELKLSAGNLSTLYPQGTKVRLLARGMTLGQYAGQVNLGYRSTDPRYETGYFPERLVGYVLVARGKERIEPIELSLDKLDKAWAGRLVRLSGVQFLTSELGQTFAAPDNKNAQANVNRTLVDASGRRLIVRTSSYARFAGRTLPEGAGSIVGILTYFQDTPQLLILREGDISFLQERFQ